MLAWFILVLITVFIALVMMKRSIDILILHLENRICILEKKLEQDEINLLSLVRQHKLYDFNSEVACEKEPSKLVNETSSPKQ